MIERNVTLDYFKLLMSIFVMTAHLYPLLSIDDLPGWLISNGIARLTMPCFFMINGYFIHSRINNPKKVFRYIKDVVVLYIVWSLIYLPHFYDFPIKRLLIAIFSGYFHLWYLVSLFIGVFLFFVLKRVLKRDKFLLPVILLLYFTGYVLQSVVADFPVSTAFKLAIFRNGLFYGLPFLFIGYYVKENESRLLAIKNTYLYVIAFICTILLFYESYLSFFVRQIHDMLVTAPIFCPVIIIILLKHSKFAPNDGYIGSLASGVYFTHIMAITLVMAVFGEKLEYKIPYLPLVFFISMLLSTMVIELNKRVKLFL